jgi:TM2 domain-containing membrane protein YozV
MGAMIHKPDTNPVIILVANWFGLGGLGYFLMGQKKKAMISWGIMVGVFVLAMCTLGLASPLGLFAIVTAYDGYLLAQKLQGGQSIQENENGLDFLNAIFKD